MLTEQECYEEELARHNAIGAVAPSPLRYEPLPLPALRPDGSYAVNSDAEEWETLHEEVENATWLRKESHVLDEDDENEEDDEDDWDDEPAENAGPKDEARDDQGMWTASVTEEKLNSAVVKLSEDQRETAAYGKCLFFAAGLKELLNSHRVEASLVKLDLLDKRHKADYGVGPDGIHVLVKALGKYWDAHGPHTEDDVRDEWEDRLDGCAVYITDVKEKLLGRGLSGLRKHPDIQAMIEGIAKHLQGRKAHNIEEQAENTAHDPATGQFTAGHESAQAHAADMHASTRRGMKPEDADRLLARAHEMAAKMDPAEFCRHMGKVNTVEMRGSKRKLLDIYKHTLERLVVSHAQTQF